MIRIYTKDVSVYEDEELFARTYERMPAYRRAKIDRIRSEKEKRLSLGAGALLMQALAEAGFSAEQMPAVGEHGKPCYPAIADRFQFSLSHSDTMALCVASFAGEKVLSVGCDIEKIRAVDLQVAKRRFCPEEAEAILSHKNEEEQRAAFFRLWTLKESYVKALGSGLTLPLDAFAIYTDPQGEIRVRESAGNGDCRFGEKRLEGGYQMAWCACNFVSPVL